MLLLTSENALLKDLFGGNDEGKRGACMLIEIGSSPFFALSTHTYTHSHTHTHTHTHTNPHTFHHPTAGKKLGPAARRRLDRGESKKNMRMSMKKAREDVTKKKKATVATLFKVSSTLIQSSAAIFSCLSHNSLTQHSHTHTHTHTHPHTHPHSNRLAT